MPLNITKKKPAGEAITSTEIKEKGETLAESHQTEPVEGPGAAASSDPFAMVSLEMSYTHNLGNFKSSKVGVAISIPCLPSEIDEAHKFTKEWVEAKMQPMVDDIIQQGE
jgi:hypothetical protein